MSFGDTALLFANLTFAQLVMTTRVGGSVRHFRINVR